MSVKPLKTAPKDGTMILLHRGAEGPPVAGYWHSCPKVKWWRQVSGGWCNAAMGWEPYPSSEVVM